MSLYLGDVRDGLREFIAAGVRAQTCVTSPPYWGLRDYGTVQWAGGDEDCEHKGPPVRTQAGFNARYFGKEFATDKQGDEREPMGQICPCGATRIDRQLGLEPTIAEYVANMVEVFRLVREVLADDGTLWLNLGDSYATGGHAGGKNGREDVDVGGWGASNTDRDQPTMRTIGNGIKPKDLCGIPWRVALALQADGWYLRQDIIWAKPNPMPESVTDRCTKSHEYLFLLAKRERYYYDAAAIAEPALQDEFRPSFRGGAYIGNATFDNGAGGASTDTGNVRIANATRNRRSVWTVTTQPYAEAHFATFPVALVEPCIMAGSRPGDIVLDPFMGSGTVAQVAQDLGRQWIGCELNPEYAQLIHRRTAQQAMVLA